MTHRMRAIGFTASLPIVMIGYQSKPVYSLFKKIDGKWYQVRTATHSAEMACRVWAEFVARNPISYSIRKASFVMNEAR